MTQIIQHRNAVEDRWQVLALNEGETPDSVALPPGDIIFPLSVWKTRKAEIADRGQALAVWLDSADDPAEIAADLGVLSLIAVNFPKFADGRGYSTARLLRSRYGWHGELRAIGDVLHDQLFYMKRCGFDSFALKEGKNLEHALANAFDTWSESYQAAVDQKLPLFRRRDA